MNFEKRKMVLHASFLPSPNERESGAISSSNGKTGREKVFVCFLRRAQKLFFSRKISQEEEEDFKLNIFQRKTFFVAKR